MSIPRWARLVFATATVVLAHSAARADDPTFELTIRNHRFEPAELQIPANTKVKLIVKNTDTTSEEFDSAELRREKVIAGGQQVVIFLGPLAPGTYNFIGEFHPDTARGRVVAK